MGGSSRRAVAFPKLVYYVSTGHQTVKERKISSHIQNMTRSLARSGPDEIISEAHVSGMDSIQIGADTFIPVIGDLENFVSILVVDFESVVGARGAA